MSNGRKWWDSDVPPYIVRTPNDAAYTHCVHELVTRALRDGKEIVQAETEGQFDGGMSELFAIVTELGGRIISRDVAFSFDEGAKMKKCNFNAVWDMGYIHVSIDGSDWSDVSVLTLDADLTNDIVRRFSGVLKKRGSGDRREVYVLTRSSDGYEMASIGAHGLPLERLNYSSDVVDAYDHIVGELGSNAPCGRVVVFEGPAGTGKTHLIRGLIQEARNTTFVLLPPTMIEGISGPNVIQALVGWRRSSSGPIVFVLEDADAVLSSRKFDNMNAVNEVLNLGDGILGAALDIRIVATTNTGKKDIDEAIMRDGRLCRHVVVGSLSCDQAAAVAARLGVDWSSGKPATLAEVYGSKRADRPRRNPKKAGF